MPVIGADQFETVAMLHLDALFQTAVQLTASRDEAEEALQEVYVSAFESLQGEVWRATRLQMFKFLMRHLRSRCTWPKSSAVGGPRGSALAGLPWDLRQILVLVDAEGLSYSQTAEILELSTDAVADGVVEAREHLLKALVL
jgi:DNA-directed RNA polymerase specialized sigma24 family protein